MAFERVNLLDEAWKTIVDLEQDAGKASVSDVLNADRAVFFPYSFFNGGRFRYKGLSHVMDWLDVYRGVDLGRI
jgi:hypothetical protein